jgi:hypothetical protein
LNDPLALFVATLAELVVSDSAFGVGDVHALASGQAPPEFSLPVGFFSFI